MDDDCQAGGIGMTLDEARMKYGKDLGPCVSAKCEDMGGEPGRLVALVTDDGRWWEADACPRCHCSWWHQVPKAAPGPEVKRMTASEFAALKGGG